MLCSVSNLLSFTHWWNWQSSMAIDVLPDLHSIATTTVTKTTTITRQPRHDKNTDLTTDYNDNISTKIKVGNYNISTLCNILLLLGRVACMMCDVHRCGLLVQTFYTARYVSVGDYTGKPCKNGWTNWDTVWEQAHVDPRNSVLGLVQFFPMGTGNVELEKGPASCKHRDSTVHYTLYGDHSLVDSDLTSCMLTPNFEYCTTS